MSRGDPWLARPSISPSARGRWLWKSVSSFQVYLRIPTSHTTGVGPFQRERETNDASRTGPGVVTVRIYFVHNRLAQDTHAAPSEKARTTILCFLLLSPSLKTIGTGIASTAKPPTTSSPVITTTKGVYARHQPPGMPGFHKDANGMQRRLFTTIDAMAQTIV